MEWKLRGGGKIAGKDSGTKRGRADPSLRKSAEIKQLIISEYLLLNGVCLTFLYLNLFLYEIVEIVYFYLIEFLLLIIILINIIKVYICILLYKIYIEE